MAKKHHDCDDVARSRFYSRYNPPPSLGLYFAPESSMTKQEFKRECDINILMAKYKMGQIDNIAPRATSVSGVAPPRTPMFGNFAEVGDYQKAQNLLIEARDQFLAMPAAVRDRFENSAEKFLEFAGGKDVGDTFESLGLLTPEATHRRKQERLAKQEAERKRIEDDAVARFVKERDKK